LILKLILLLSDAFRPYLVIKELLPGPRIAFISGMCDIESRLHNVKAPAGTAQCWFIFSGRLLLVIESKRARGVIMALLYVRSAQLCHEELQSGFLIKCHDLQHYHKCQYLLSTMLN
jgi:hypothetical protein